MSLLEDLGQKKIAQMLYRGMHAERYLGAKSRIVRADQVGDAWPLTVPEVELFWAADAIFVRASGHLYRVNGWATSYLKGIGEEVLDIRDIQQAHPEIPELLMSTTPLFDLARELEHEENPPVFSRWWWRRWGLRVLKLVFTPLNLVVGIAELILKGLTALISLRGGSVVALAIFFLLISLSVLTTGLLFQELWDAFTGLWQEPFWDHGIFYVIGGIATPLVIIAYLAKHQDQDGRR